MSFNETRELEQLPGKIEALEKEQANLTEALADGSLFVKSPDAAAGMSTRLEVVASEIEAAMNRWELLENKRTELSG
jgi:ATP-binding cassette subfamily F protein uup